MLQARSRRASCVGAPKQQRSGGVMTDTILTRDEALDAVWILTDILAELRLIREIFEDGEEEEDQDES
jgi:hypothetical protein